MYVLQGDTYVGRSLELYGECSRRELELLLQLIKPNGVVVEVGANIGCHTIAMAKACAPAPLFAFEPQQRVFQLLCANLVANEVSNVVALPEACSDKDGTVSLPRIDYARPQNFGSVGVVEAPENMPVTRVRCSTVDALGLTQCRLLKVDVEGFEERVLRGAERTIRELRPLLYVENAVAEHQQTVISLIHELGYRQWWHTPPLYSDDNFAGNAENVFPGIVSVNIVAIPREMPGGPPSPPIDPANWQPPVAPLSQASFRPKNAP